MNSTASSSRPIVVCAMEIERAALISHGLADMAEVHCCGLGADGVRAWTARFKTSMQTVIFCGMAGALDPRLATGAAHVISEVRDEAGNRWAPSVAPRQSCIVVSTQAIVASPAAKADLSQRTGAHMVDMESVAFASEAQRLGWNWGIVRGISDDAEESLPHNIDDWIHPNGRLRWLTIAKSIMRRPLVIGSLLRMHKGSRRAMAAAAGLAKTLLQDETAAH